MPQNVTTPATEAPAAETPAAPEAAAPATEAPAETAATATVTPDAPEAPAAAAEDDPYKDLTREELLAKYLEERKHSRTWEKRHKGLKKSLEAAAADPDDDAAGDNPAAPETPAAPAAETDEITQLRQQLAEVEAEKTRLAHEALTNAVATAKGVPADILTGTTKEELEASADALLAWAKAQKAPTNDTSASGPQGTPITGPRQLTYAEMLALPPAELDKARRQGLLKDVLSGN